MGKLLRNRLLRIFIGYLLPIFLAVIITFCAVLIYILFKGKKINDFFSLYSGLFLSINLLLFYFLSIPSFTYSCLMEFLINPKITRNYFVVLISVALGLAFTLFGIWLYIFIGGRSSIIFYIFDLFVGCLVSFFSSIWLRFIYIKYSNRQCVPKLFVIANMMLCFYFVYIVVLGVLAFIDMTNTLI